MLVLAFAAGTVMSIGAVDVFGAPKGMKIRKGRAKVSVMGDVTTIKVGRKAILEYDSFDILSGETVRFEQPGKKSRVLNRVNSLNPSMIDGTIEANGRVYITNGAGVVFGPGSIVNVGQLFAGAGDMSNKDFLRGVNRFSNVTGDVRAEGFITADAVHLIGQRVSNHGQIVANDGMVSMLVGGDVMLREKNGQIMVRLKGGAAEAGVYGVENTGTIDAPNGIVSLGAGDTYSLAVRNSGSINASGGEVRVHGAGGVVTNAGSIDVGVVDGDAGGVFISADELIHTGSVSADADNGRAGRVELLATTNLVLEDGSTVTAAGGSGVAAGGSLLVYALDGDTVMESGALVDISGGALGGDGGDGEISAKYRLGVHGMLEGEAADGYKQASLLLDPSDIVISAVGTDDGEIGDGTVAGGDGGIADVFHISPTAIEGFAGDISLEATNDIFISSSIDKTNGGLTLEAGRDILFSSELGGMITDLEIKADYIEFTANRDIVERVLTGSRLIANTGDINLTARNGNVKFSLADVQAGRTVRITQADSRYVGAGPFGFLANPETTNLEVRVTDGFLILGGDFGGVTGTQDILSIDAHAAEYLRVEDNLTIGDFADLRANDDVEIAGFIHSNNLINLHSGMDGTGDVVFERGGKPDLDLWASSINLRAGNNSGLGIARVRLDTAGGSAPLLRGAGGGATRPGSLVYQQDAPVADSDLAANVRFGSGDPTGMSYWIESNDSSVVLSTPDKVVGTILTLASETGSTVQNDINPESLTVWGTSKLNGDVTSDLFQTYHGGVVIGGDRELTGTTVMFNDTLDGMTSGGEHLVINASSIFNGATGDTDKLRSLEVNGTSDLNGERVTTRRGQRYNGAVALGVDTSLESTDSGTIRFGSTVDGAFDMDVLTTPGGLIVFAGDVGMGEQLVDMHLSTAGQSGVRGIPEIASIIGETDLNIRAENFTMTQHEKFTTLGSLDLRATESATLGDLVTINDMFVQAPTITLLLRQPSTLYTYDGTKTRDRGLDYVAGGGIIFDGNVLMGGEAGAPPPTFGNPSTLVSLASLDLAGFEISESTINRTSFLELHLDSIVLDQKTLIIPPPSPSESIVSQHSRDPIFKDSVQPEVYDIDLLNRLAVAAHGVDGKTSLDGMIGRLIYGDEPATPSAFGSGTTMTAARFDIHTAMEIAERYQSIFGTPEAPTGELARAQVAAAMEGDATDSATIAELRALLAGLRGMGVPTQEYKATCRVLCEQVTPAGRSVEDVERLLLSEPEAPQQAPESFGMVELPETMRGGPMQ
jgi:filamentous hemagglutinin family protein